MSNAPQPNACVFKKFPSKEATLLKPHPDTTEEQWKEFCDLFTSETFMVRDYKNSLLKYYIRLIFNYLKYRKNEASKIRRIDQS